MKRTQTIWLIVVLALAVFAIPSLVAAGRSGTESPGTEPPIVTDPHAKGLKVPGVMAVHYQTSSGECLEELGPSVSMTLFMRLEPKKEIFPFGGYAPSVCYWDFSSQQEVVNAYIKTQVLPFLYEQGIIKAADACFAFKEVSDIVDDIDGDFTDPEKPVFSLLNFVLAIDDKKHCP